MSLTTIPWVLFLGPERYRDTANHHVPDFGGLVFAKNDACCDRSMVFNKERPAWSLQRGYHARDGASRGIRRIKQGHLGEA
jgi:hypothetical protein